MITRRNFMQSGILAAIGSCTLGLTGKVFGQTLLADDLFLIPPESLNDPILTLTSEHFVPFINTTFQFRHSQIPGNIILRLVDVHRPKINNSDKGVRGESYSLLFDAERTIHVEQLIYDVSHNGLGKFSLFIAPVLPEPNLYEAVVNRLSR